MEKPRQFRRTSKEIPPSPFDLRPREVATPPDKEDYAEDSERDDNEKENHAYHVDGTVHCEALEGDRPFWKIFTDVRSLGKGHFAKVEQVRHRETSEDFAVKILDKTLDDNDVNDLIREFTMLKNLTHQNIGIARACHPCPLRQPLDHDEYYVVALTCEAPKSRPGSSSLRCL